MTTLNYYNSCNSAQPLHWVKDDNLMQQAVLSCPDTPEFLTPSANPYYRLPLGQPSPYGDQIMVQLRSLVSCKGLPPHLHCLVVTISFIYLQDSTSIIFLNSLSFFGAGSPYDNPLQKIRQENGRQIIH